MKRKTKIMGIGISLFCAIYIHTVSAQKTGVINYPTVGISFEVPAGWVGQETETSVVMSCETVPGFIYVFAHQIKDMTAMKKDAKLPISDENGTNILLTGALEKMQDNAIAGFYTGSINWKPYVAYIIFMINPYGNGISIMTATTPEAYTNDYKETGLELAKSVCFYKPEVAGAAPTGNSLWSEKLQNCRLTYMASYNSPGAGYGTKIKIDLCAQGYFNHSSYSSMSVEVTGAFGSSGSNNSGTGIWNAVVNAQGKDVLQLHFYSGEVYEYIITTDEDDKTYLNGERYFRTYEGDYGPDCN